MDFSQDKDFNQELHDLCQCILNYYHDYQVDDDVNFKRNNMIFDIYRLIYDKIMAEAFGDDTPNTGMVTSWMEKLSEKSSMTINTTD